MSDPTIFWDIPCHRLSKTQSETLWQRQGLAYLLAVFLLDRLVVDLEQWCCQVAPLATRSFTACTTGTSWAAPVEFTTWSDMALLAYTMILMFYALSLTSSDGMCHLPKMFWVVFAPLSNHFWNFRPSWTGTVGSRGQKTGGKGDFRLSFWKPLSFWICWPGRRKVAAGVARRWFMILKRFAGRAPPASVWKCLKSNDWLPNQLAAKQAI